MFYVICQLRVSLFGSLLKYIANTISEHMDNDSGFLPAFSRWNTDLQINIKEKKVDFANSKKDVVFVENAAQEQEQMFAHTEQSLKLYGDAVLRAAYTYLHNIHDAEDVVQETFLRLFRANAVFDSAEHEKAWLLRVAINLSKNKLKSAWFRKTNLQSDDFDNKFAACYEDKDLKYVWDAVKSLPIKYREVIHLFYQEGFSTAEIASVLDKKESTVRSLLSRGRNLLRGILREEYDFDE